MPLVRGINLEFGVNRYTLLCYCCSITKLCLSLRPRGLQHAQLSCPSLSPGACSNLCPLRQWYYPNISPSVTPFSSCSQAFPTSESFPMSQLFISGGQSVGTSALANSPSSEYSRLIFISIDWFDLLIVQGTLKSLLQYHSSKASILQHSAFFMVQLICMYVYA